MISPAPSRVVIEVRIHTRGSLNARGSWQARWRRTKKERAATHGAIQLYQLSGGEFRSLPRLPVRVHIVRVSPGHRPVDSDNLPGYSKGVRDQIAAYYGVDDGPSGPISWSYAAERGPSHLVRVEIEARG